MTELATIESLAKSWEDFKVSNDAARVVATAEATAQADKWNDRLGEIVAALDKEKEEREALETIVNRPGATQTDIATDLAVRDFYSIVKNQDMDEIVVTDVLRDSLAEYSVDYSRFIRKGDITDAMQVGREGDGGYWVDPELSTKITEFIVETSSIRELATIETISTDALEGEYDLEEAGSGGWVGETEARPATATPGIGKWRIPVHEQYANPRATQKVLDDSFRQFAGALILFLNHPDSGAYLNFRPVYITHSTPEELRWVTLQLSITARTTIGS